MTTNEIRESITYLEGQIERFILFKGKLETSTNQKDKTKYNEFLFDEMIDARDYIKEYGIYRFAFYDKEKAENVFLTGLTKPKYFVADLRNLLNKLKEKLN